jgi:EAL and modified HD-GYP domain-containing signal transduction protein
MGTTLIDSPFPATVGAAITRQAIHDRWSRVVGYELLFLDPVEPDGADEERATGSAIVETLTGIGLNHVVGRQPAHVRATRRFLLDQHAFALPSERVVLEIEEPDPEDVPLRVVLERLAESGYRISLTWNPRSPQPSPALARIADSIALDVSGMSGAEIDAVAARLRPAARTLLATGVDTPALLERCRAAGFDRFQGFFFCTPDVVHVHTPPTSRLAELQSLAGLYAQTITFEEFERIIARDPGLSYRLIAYLNSAFFNLPRQVASAHEALMMLGMKAVRRWATLIALSSDVDKPHELTVTALLRGRLCELIGRQRPAPTVGADAFFTVGVFSVMDAMMDAPLEEVLDALPLAPETRDALLHHAGPMGDALAATIAFERGDLATVEHRLPGVPVAELYLHAVHWADAASGALGDEDAEIADDGACEQPAAQDSDGEDDGDGAVTPAG